MTQADCGERGFNRIRRSQVSPVLRREVVVRQQHVTVLRQAVARCRVFRFVLFKELVERFARSFPRFGVPDFVQV